MRVKLIDLEAPESKGWTGSRPRGEAVLEEISTRIFADGADLDEIIGLSTDRRIAGFTTNPTLMWKAGLTDYAEFAQRLLERITEHPISFEVFADDAEEMRRQAHKIAKW